ncbi:Gfo/Idh/MocA family oxidoreductase [uncultured Winogradskyella sp.]|uniref:Gfo/Idh/MocA family protein n=1 Tax=uncultured Winogradskyella sp. TaxID=395353 RepID=UPI00262A75D9|nr:Gfo/Idh/MocA family oxidoreductase [uncultured Winogradskyella sp.]
MNKKVIRWGIIGAGKIAKKFAEDLNTVFDSELYAIASRSLKKAEHFASEYNANLAYGNYEALTLDPNIDAIYIATPHSFHKTHTLLCLEQQIPVLCEKPFAMNHTEVQQMIALAKANNTLLMEAMWTAFLPHFQYVLDLIKRKHYGNVIALEADFGFRPKYDETSRLFDKSVGGGSLLDIGIYPIFAALSTLGQPNLIEAKADFFENGADSECKMTFHYNTCKAFLKSTIVAETKTEAIFKCEEGNIIINGRFHEASSVTLIDKHGNSELKTFDYNTIGYNYEIEHFNQLIRTNKKESDIMTFNKSIALISTLDKVREIIGLEYKN